MRPTRRKMLLGMGALATGSGALFSSGAFANAVASSADLRVLVEQRGIVFRPNDDATDESNVVDGTEGFFNGNDGLDEEGAFSDLEPPLAATNGEPNEDLELSAVVELGDSARFEELFVLENDTERVVYVGIAYDRANSNYNDGGGAGQYGEDVSVNGNDGISPGVSRSAYRFEVNSYTGDDSNIDLTTDDFAGENPENGLISPATNATDFNLQSGDEESTNNNLTYVGDSDSIANQQDRPADAIRLGPGESVTIDLVVDTSFSEDVQDAITTQSDLSGTIPGFGVERDTVDLLDGITVGTIAAQGTDDPYTESNGQSVTVNQP